MKFRTKRVVALAIVILAVTFTIPHIGLWSTSSSESQQSAEETDIGIGTGVAKGETTCMEDSDCDTGYVCLGSDIIGICISTSDPVRSLYDSCKLSCQSASNVDDCISKECDIILNSGSGSTTGNDWYLCDEKCQEMTETEAWGCERYDGPFTDGTCKTLKAGGSGSGSIDCTSYDNYDGKCVNLPTADCNGVTAQSKSGECGSFPENQCCVSTEKTVNDCNTCVLSNWVWCQDKGGHYYCSDPKQQPLVRDTCIRDYTPYVSTQDCGISSTPKPRSPNQGTGIGSGVSCKSCILRNIQENMYYDVNRQWFYCNRNTLGSLGIYTVGRVSQNGQCMSYTKSDNANKIQQFNLCSSGIVVEDVGNCPPTLSCTEQCQLQYNSGGYSSAITTRTTNVYNQNSFVTAYGDCSTRPETGVNTNVAGVSTGFIARMLGSGENFGCVANEYCNCYVVNPAAATTAIGAIINTANPVIAGTDRTAHWTDPDKLTDVPKKELNDHNCDLISNATIAGIVKPTIAQVGSIVTVSGDVGKLSETCNGYERTCRATKEVAYKKNSGFWRDEYDIQPCPADYPKVVYKQCGDNVGEEHCKDWKTGRIGIIAAVVAAIVACSFATTYTAGSASGCWVKVGGFMKSTFAGAAVPGGKGAGTAVGTSLKVLSGIGAAITTVTSLANRLNSKGAYSSATGTSSQEAGKTPSFSICAKEYKTNVSANPTCYLGGNVIGYKEGVYKCSSASCQAYPDRDVAIKVYNSKGELVQDTTTRTDSNGKFSYSFTAPALEGKYSVVVAVPGLRPFSTTGAVVAKNAQEWPVELLLQS